MPLIHSTCLLSLLSEILQIPAQVGNTNNEVRLGQQAEADILFPIGGVWTWPMAQVRQKLSLEARGYGTGTLSNDR